MEIDINKLFQEKNKDIFKNSLILEMERNLEALKNTTDNCVALETNKLSHFLNNYFSETKIKYKREELLGFLYREKEKKNKIVNDKIEEKKRKIKENFLEKKIEKDKIDDEYINNYYSELTTETNIVNDEIELEIKKEICMVFFQELLSKYKLNTQEQQERLNSRINILFCQTIIKKIKEQTIFRDESLKNMTKESFKKYLKLNENTLE